MPNNILGPVYAVMLRLVLGLFAYIVLIGCSNTAPELSPGVYQVIRELGRKATWVTLDAEIATRREIFRKKIGEPDIRQEKLETYRWVFSRPFDARIFLFRVLIYRTDSAELITKIAAGPGNFEDSTFVQHEGAHFFLKKDSLLSFTTQRLSAVQVDQVQTLLRGSYYWALADPYPNGSGFFDGENLSLESMSQPHGARRLQYHSVSIHVPFDGSFKQTAVYVASLSSIGAEAVYHLTH